MPDNQIEHTEIQSYEHNEIFETEEEMRESLSRLCYGDLYVIGRMWIEILKTGLLGLESALVPVVTAAEPPLPPKRPPPMRYKDLPLYQTPHYEYKDYEADRDKCPKANVKIANEFLFPYVSSYRRSIQESFCEFSCDFKDFKNEIKCGINNKKVQFKNYMQCPKNLAVRQAVVALGGVAGYYIGSAKGLPTRIFTTGLGLLATGALCFPKETDTAFRTFTYHTAKTARTVYNAYCKKMSGLKERVPCPEDIPTPPKDPRKLNTCPVK